MAQIIARLAIFFLLINLSTGMVMGSPIAEDLGIQTTVGGDERIEEAKDEADKVEAGNAGDSTLFGLYNTVTSGVSTIINVVTAGPLMLNQLGVPGAITGMLQVVIGIIYALGVASFLRGFNIL